MTTTYDGQRVVTGGAVCALALLIGLAGLGWTVLATFTLAVEGPTHAQHVRAAAGLAVGSAGASALGVASWRWVRAPGWSLVVAVLVALALAAGAGLELSA